MTGQHRAAPRPWYPAVLVAVAAVAATVAGVLLAGCGSGHQAPAAAPAAAAATTAPDTGAPANNALACRDYLAQRAKYKGKTEYTLADIFQFETDIAMDADLSTGQLHRDLAAMQAAIQAGIQSMGTSHHSDYAESVRVYQDCTGPGKP